MALRRDVLARQRSARRPGPNSRRLPNDLAEPAAPERPEGRINLTDPDSRLVKATRGWIQGYNAQAAVSARLIVLAAEVTADSPDFGHLEPMVDATAELEKAGVRERPQVALADAGYWHQQQMERIVSRGTQVLIPPDPSKRKGARPGWRGGYYAFMRRVLQPSAGGSSTENASR